MGFRQSPGELDRARSRETINFFDAEMLSVVWVTSPATVERLLPPPLEPARMPLVMGFVANYPRTDFGVSYREAALFLMASFNGKPGLYCLAMPVTDDTALILGREVFGYPKKIADIAFHREGQEVGGWAERHGIRFFDLRVKLGGGPHAADAQAIITQLFNLGSASNVVTVYLFKHFPAPNLDGFDYPPRLVREEIEFRHLDFAVGEAEVVLTPSEYDPWREVDVVRVLGGVYTKGNNSMRKGEVLTEVEPIAFAPYSRMKVDPF